MVSLSRLISGIVFILAGVFFIVLAFYEVWWVFFYGLIPIILGIVILINKNEDKIEERKDLNKTKNNK